MYLIRIGHDDSVRGYVTLDMLVHVSGYVLEKSCILIGIVPWLWVSADVSWIMLMRRLNHSLNRVLLYSDLDIRGRATSLLRVFSLTLKLLSSLLSREESALLARTAFEVLLSWWGHHWPKMRKENWLLIHWYFSYSLVLGRWSYLTLIASKLSWLIDSPFKVLQETFGHILELCEFSYSLLEWWVSYLLHGSDRLSHWEYFNILWLKHLRHWLLKVLFST